MPASVPLTLEEFLDQIAQLFDKDGDETIARDTQSVQRTSMLIGHIFLITYTFVMNLYDNPTLEQLTALLHQVLSTFQEEISCNGLHEEFTDFISLAAHRTLEHKQIDDHASTLEAELRGKYHFESIIGHHPKIVEILKLVAQVANTNATVLIQGESGTGKELIARAFHYNSRRKEKPLVPINCAALPEHLLESELFGHVRGAFTGAIKGTAGWFERADGGTIFLDEVNDMSLALQVKLLRILQTGEYSRVGSTEIRHSDVRVVAATSQDLQTLVKEGKFREEVYYRLNVIDLWLPPLRDRKCDIPLLARHFLGLYGAKYGKQNLRLSSEAEVLLLAYDFPGNVRELENIIQRAVVLSEGEFIEPHHLPTSVYREWTASALKEKKSSTFKVAKQHAVEQFERDYIIDCLKSTRGNISRGAQVAGIDVKNFYEKMTKYGIDPHSFKKPSE